MRVSRHIIRDKLKGDQKSQLLVSGTLFFEKILVKGRRIGIAKEMSPLDGCQMAQLRENSTLTSNVNYWVAEAKWSRRSLSESRQFGGKGPGSFNSRCFERIGMAFIDNGLRPCPDLEAASSIFN